MGIARAMASTRALQRAILQKDLLLIIKARKDRAVVMLIMLLTKQEEATGYLSVSALLLRPNLSAY